MGVGEGMRVELHNVLCDITRLHHTLLMCTQRYVCAPLNLIFLMQKCYACSSADSMHRLSPSSPSSPPQGKAQHGVLLCCVRNIFLIWSYVLVQTREVLMY